MDDQIIKDITAEIDNAFTPEGAAEIGMLTIKTANQTVEDAAMRPDPDQLYHELWYEGEVCCLFADSNLGKSIYAVQMANEISQTRNVLYVDCELSDKQFQLRYTNSESGERHIFPDGLLRAEVNPYAIGAQGYEEAIIRDIETAAKRTGTKVIIIDNLTYLCNSADKGVDAGIFMMKLMALKKNPDNRSHPETGPLKPHHPEPPRRIKETLQLLRLRLRHRNERQRQPPPLRQASQSQGRSLHLRCIKHNSLRSRESQRIPPLQLPRIRHRRRTPPSPRIRRDLRTGNAGT